MMQRRNTNRKSGTKCIINTRTSNKTEFFSNYLFMEIIKLFCCDSSKQFEVL